MRTFLHAVVGVAFAAMSASVAKAEPAILYDLGGKSDKSFNQAAFNGAERFRSETGSGYGEFEVVNESQREQALRNFVRRGHSPIISIGFAQASALKEVAREFPDLEFAIIDMVVDLPNVRSIVFREHEGSYLVGMLAAMASETGKVGFVGGMDIPLIRKFACGYAQGARSVNADIEVFQNMTGTTAAAWNDPVRGGELARAQIDRGADVIYHAAGTTGLGVLQAAADAGKLGIGVDSNQNGLQPGSVLTSMLKRVDVAVFNAMNDHHTGNWSPGTNVLGLAQDGVGYALDENNEALVTDEMRAAVDAARADIIAGNITVHDYMSDGTCPK